jgi:hypothetical protein
LLSVRSGAVVPSSTPGSGAGRVLDLQAEALTRVLSAEDGASRSEYDQSTFRVEGLVVETSKRHADQAFVILQGHLDGEIRHQVLCVFGTKERDSLHGVEVGNRVKAHGEYHVPAGEPGTEVILSNCKLAR